MPRVRLEARGREDAAEIHLRIHVDIDHKRRWARAVELEQGEIRQSAHVSEFDDQIGSVDETTIQDVVGMVIQKPQQESEVAGSPVRPLGQWCSRPQRWSQRRRRPRLRTTWRRPQ